MVNDGIKDGMNSTTHHPKPSQGIQSDPLHTDTLSVSGRIRRDPRHSKPPCRPRDPIESLGQEDAGTSASGLLARVIASGPGGQAGERGTDVSRGTNIRAWCAPDDIRQQDRSHRLAVLLHLDRLNTTFFELYASEGRPSVSPEQLLLLALLQHAFYGIRSVRLLLVQFKYNLLFRWFVGLSPDDPIWHPTTCTKNRECLLNEQVLGR